jgi:hypothetical protein
MGIVSIFTDTTGQVGVYPRRVKILTTDSLATVTTAGYLNAEALSVYTIYPTDVFDIIYLYVTATNSGTYGKFLPTFTNGIITLIQSPGTGGVVLPTIANHIATYTDTAGTLSEDAATAINGGNIQAGLSGTAGTVASFPATAAKGSLVLKGVANAGNTLTTISNAAMGQASVVSIPDPGTATADFAVAPAALVNNNLIKANGTVGLIADAGIAASNVMSLAATNTMAASSMIILDKATATTTGGAATINKEAGVLTTESLTTVAGSAYAITLTNSKIATTSVILTSYMGGTNPTVNLNISAVAGSGSATISVHNNDPSAAFNGTVIIGFAIF